MFALMDVKRLLVALLALRTVAAESLCSSQADCNSVSEVSCGFCAEDESTSGISLCSYPFLKFLISTTRCVYAFKCDSTCSGHGICGLEVSQDKIVSCLCEDGFYGWTCEHSDPPGGHLKTGLFRRFELPFENKMAPAVARKREVVFDCGSKEEKDTGYLSVFSGDGGQFERVAFNRMWCKYNTSVRYQFSLKFRYIPLGEKNVAVKKLRNDVLGYFSSFNINVILGNIINFHKDFPIIIDYGKASLECVPVIELSGCGSSWSKSTTSSQQITIGSNVYFIADGKFVSTSVEKPECESKAEYKWNIWKDNGVSRNHLSYYSMKKLEFEPFFLVVGSYRITLEVELVQESPSTNFAYCYLNVTFEPLIAIIDGGSERVVNKNSGVFLETTRSRDPNQPPDKQEHVMASWSCVDVSDPVIEICEPTKALSVSNGYIVPAEDLEYGAEYVIKLRVWTSKSTCSKRYGQASCEAFAFSKIIVAKESIETDYDDSFIQCIHNCKEKVVNNQRLFLKVKNRRGIKARNYTWTYYEGAQGKEVNAETISEKGLPSFYFLVGENVFARGKRFTVVVKNNELKTLVKYSFETLDVNFDGNCSMEPMTGIIGLTNFHITCHNFSRTSSFHFEFYDKTPEEAEDELIFSGRMLGTSDKGELQDFRVTRGHVFVYVIHTSGLYTHQRFYVNISHQEVNDKVVDEILHNITKYKDRNKIEEACKYILFLPDIVPNSMNKSKVLEFLLHFLPDIPIGSVSKVKIAISILYNVVVKLNDPLQLEIEVGLMANVLRFIKDKATVLREAVDRESDLQGMSHKAIINVLTILLKCLDAILKCKDLKTVDLQEFDFDFATEDYLLNTANYLEEVISQIQDTLTFLQSPGLPPISISTKNNSSVLMVLKNDEDYDLTNYMVKGVSVNVSRDFLNQFKPSTNKVDNNDLFLRIATFEDNIFWWRSSDVKSNLISVSLASYHHNRKISTIKYVKNALDIKINLKKDLINTTVVSDSTFIYNTNMKRAFDLDLAIKIHRLDPDPNSLITLKFLYPETNGSLLVWVVSDRRPDCANMKQKATEITAESPYYEPVLVWKLEPTFFYIGIIPTSNITNSSVSYTFEVNTTLCQHWSRGHWRSQGCRISKVESTDLEVLCSCEHFSTFAAAFPVPPQEVDPFSDITLFLTVLDNPVVVVFVTVVLLLYLIGCVWAWRKDKSAKTLSTVIILDDNFPGDRYPYLLVVYTSSRLNSGTTAHVGVKIIGSLATSRAHILASPLRPVFRRNSDDWFLMFTPESLGELKAIHIWHDNAGSSPDWFCDKIIVYDVKYSLDAVFLVEQWLALRPDCYPEAAVTAATVSQVKNVKRMFVDNCVTGLREGHILLSIIFRHPRSEISRLQKINGLMCCLMVVMLCNIMWYDTAVDASEFDVDLRDLFISISSLVLGFCATCVVLFAFKNSYSYVYNISPSSTLYRPSTYKEYDALQDIGERKTVYANYVRFVSRTLKRHPLTPVQLAETRRVVRKRTLCLIIAWVLCLAIILTCSFFVMLYGLKLGLTKSKKWLLSVFFTLSEEIFIVGPIKVLFLALILSVAFQKITETETHEVDVKATMKVKRVLGELDTYEKVYMKRTHPMYAPLRSDMVENMMRKKVLWENWWTSIEFVVSICFVVVLSFVVFWLWSSNYYMNNHVRNIITQAHNPRKGSKNLLRARNITEVNNFLQYSLMRSLYISFWYNKMSMRDEGTERGYWAEDFTLRQIGLQRLRQVRVSPVSCGVGSVRYVNESGLCVPGWEEKHEDTGDYSTGWTEARWHDVQVNSSPWRYTGRSEGQYAMYRLRGGSGTLYHDGGYLVDLGPERTTAQKSLDDLVNHAWQDPLTSALFLELTLYNVNRDLLSQLTAVVEYPPSGGVLVKTRVMSVESNMSVTAWHVLPLFFILYYSARCARAINRHGLLVFLTSFLNITQVIVVLLIALCFLLATIHHFSSTAKYKCFVHKGQTSYFDFDSFVYYFLWLRVSLYVLFGVALLRALLVFRGGRTFMNYFYTLAISVSWTTWLTLVTVLFLTLQLLWVLLCDVTYIHNIRDVIINPEYNVKYVHPGYSTGAFILLKIIFMRVINMCYVLLFIHYFKIAKANKLKKSHMLNVLNFMFRQVGTRLSKLSLKRLGSFKKPPSQVES